MDDEDDDIMLHNHSLIPERDLSGLHSGVMNQMDLGGGDGVNYPGDVNMYADVQTSNVTNSQHLGTQAEAAFNQQRIVVSRLSREEIEDRYVSLFQQMTMFS